MAAAIVIIVLGIICRIFTPDNILLGLGGVTYLRLSVVTLLFALTFHFLFPEH